MPNKTNLKRTPVHKILPPYKRLLKAHDSRTAQLATIGIVGVLLFFALAVTLPIKNSVLGTFFQKLLSHAASTPTHVQSILTKNGNLVTLQPATFVNPVTTGDLIVVAVSSWNGSSNASVASVTDNFGNVYTKAVEDPTPNTGATEPLSIWYAKNVTGGSNFTVTANFATAATVTVAIHEYSGVDKVSPLDQVMHQSATGTQASSGLTATTTQSSELIFGAFNETSGTNVPTTPGSGYTLRQTQLDNNTYEALSTEDQVATNSGQYQATLTFGSSVTYRGTVVTFKPDTTDVPTPTASPTPTPIAATATSFSLNVPGFNDNISKAIVRTNTDKVYVFAGQAQYTGIIKAYWTSSPGYPTSAADFTGTTSATAPANVITVDAVYDGANTIHVLAPDMTGALRDYPFDLTTNTFKPAIPIATGDPTVSGDYIGTEGVSGLVGTDGTLSVAYWSSGNHITYKQFTYDSTTNALSGVSGPTQIDTAGSSSHPVLAISPVDGLVTLAWVSEATSPAKVLTRTRDNTGTWGTILSASTAPVWTSTNSGINIDQGPTLIIDSNNNKHLVYMENFDATGQYGKQHYVFQSVGSTTWIDTPTAFYSHATGLGIDTSGTLFIIGHGLATDTAPCQSTLDMCYIRKPAGGNWSNPVLVMTHTGTNSLDSSASVKWGVTGWNKPETVEYIFFQANAGNYNNTTLMYGRFASATGAVPTFTPAPTIGGPTATPTNTPTPTPTLLPTNTPSPTPTPGGSFVIPAHVQSTQAKNGGSVTSLKATFAASVTSGNTIVVAVSSWNASNTTKVNSVTDSKGNVYTKAVEDTAPNSSEPLSIWYATNVTGGSSFAITANMAAAGAVTLAIHEYKGVATVSPIDKTAHQNATGTAATSGSIATTQTEELLFGAFGNLSGNTIAATAGSGYTLRQSQPNDASFESLYTEDRVVSTTSTYAATLSFAKSIPYRAALVSLKAAGQ